MSAFVRHCIRQAIVAAPLCGRVLAAVAQRDAADIHARAAARAAGDVRSLVALARKRPTDASSPLP